MLFIFKIVVKWFKWFKCFKCFKCLGLELDESLKIMGTTEYFIKIRHKTIYTLKIDSILQRTF